MSTNPTVYLAGPITGLSYEDATNSWRRDACEYLWNHHINAYSPMRGKDFLKDEVELSGGYNAYSGIASSSGVVTRDHHDVRSCDVMLVNFLGAKRISIGTCIEFGWAHAYRKPIICIMENDNVHQHIILSEIAGYIVPTLAQGLDITRLILTPGE